MKGLRFLAVIGVITLIFAQSAPVHGQFGNILKGAKKALGLDQGLSTSKIVEGLKEALRIGTGNAVGTVSQVGGYYDNPRIKIPLPEKVQKLEKLLRATGFGPKLDAFELSMNRAAEKAAPEAKSIFWNAIKQMSFSDARKILDGRDNEATLYFKDKTWDRLHGLFEPIVHDSMSEVGVTRQYQDLENKVSSMPFAGNLNLDLDNYVTDKGLDGLFFMLAEEEKKIRKDPAARVTDLLKEVFGKR